LDLKAKKQEGKLILTESQRQRLEEPDKESSDYIEQLFSTNKVRRLTMKNQSSIEENPLLKSATREHFEKKVRRETQKRLSTGMASKVEGITEE
jgi:hypothetical protein